jgi:uncharacterized protein YlzI (FlbEa/FlbD family)
MIKLTNATLELLGQTLLLNPSIIISVTPVDDNTEAKSAIHGMNGKDVATWVVKESIDKVYSKLKGNLP